LLDHPVDFQEFERLIEGAARKIQFGAQLFHGQAGRALQLTHYLVHYLGGRKRSANEVILNLVIFAPAQEDAISRIHGPASPAHLLIISDSRAGPLEVNDKPKVRLVETHAECNGGD